MSVRVVFDPFTPASRSPYRVLEEGTGLDWANEFLDSQHLRGLSPRTLRAYAHDLVHIARWLAQTGTKLADLTEARLTEYIRYQLNHGAAPQSINHRISVARCIYRFHHETEIPSRGCSASIPPPFWHGRRRRVFRTLGVKVPRRVVVPLTAREVAQFWSGLKTYRDLGIVALMLFSGLRSCEVLNLKLEDLHFDQNLVLVQGKGNRQRMLPLDPQTRKILDLYLRLERPKTDSSSLFLVLKGQNRGKPLKPTGLRTVFRHHRITSDVRKANPHRLRHTFGADMVRAGMSLPALMKLMGHSHIHTTMRYVQLFAQDVWREFYRAVQNRQHPPLPEAP